MKASDDKSLAGFSLEENFGQPCTPKRLLDQVGATVVDAYSANNTKVSQWDITETRSFPLQLVNRLILNDTQMMSMVLGIAADLVARFCVILVVGTWLCF